MFYVIVIRYLYSIIRARDVKLPFYTLSTLIRHYHNLSYSAYKTIYLREILLTRIKNIRLIPPEFQTNPPRGNL